MPKQSERISILKILRPPILFPKNKFGYIFLDTNVFIAALEDEEFLKFVLELRKDHHVLFTIPQVIYEFGRGSNNIDHYNTRVRFIDSIVDTVFPIDKYLESGRHIEFSLLMRKLVSKGEYIDFLLCLCTYVMPGAYLFTGDHKAMTLSLFNRDQIITTDDQKSIQSFGFYSISKQKVDIALAGL